MSLSYLTTSGWVFFAAVLGIGLEGLDGYLCALLKRRRSDGGAFMFALMLTWLLWLVTP